MEISNKIPFSNPKFKNGLEPFQHKIVKDVLESRKKIVMINAPTGSGKSPIGMTLAHHLNYPNQSLYLCSSKILQDQLAGDFTEAYRLKGRGNYPCTLLPTYNADRCFQQCDEYKAGDIHCDYEDAKKEALSSTFAILNMHYYATETNFVGRFSKRKTVIIDEADILEDVLIDFIALDIHPKTLEKFKLDQPKYVTKLDSWKEWAEKTLKILGERVAKLRAAEDHLDNESKLELNKLSRMCLKLNMLKNDITEDWIFEHGEKFRFQPLWLDTKLTQQYLLKHAERFIMMSATMLPKVIACKLLGLDINDVDYHEIDSPIPIANRPIIYKPIKELKYGESEDDVYKEVKKIIDKHKGVKGFIPAVSYTRAKAIAGLSSRCIVHNIYDKNEKIRQFFDSKDGVLVSPSCDRGLDLCGDLARFNIIPKVPFPNTTDKVVSKRIYSSPFGKIWYKAVTAQTIVQQAGRTTRGISDSSTTYIFDAKFDSVIEFTPKWFRDAIKVEF